MEESSFLLVKDGSFLKHLDMGVVSDAKSTFALLLLREINFEAI